MRRFLATVDGMTVQEEAAFIEFLKESGVDWWHWTAGFWLMIDPKDQRNTIFFRDMLSTITNNKPCLVMNADKPEVWAGRGPSNANMFDWLRTKWPLESDEI